MKWAKPRASDYRAYLVRFWREANGPWRASIEDPHTGERHSFADLATLYHFWDETLTPQGDTHEVTTPDSAVPPVSIPKGKGSKPTL